MTILAFDVAKNEIVGVRADKNGREQETFTLPNTPAAIEPCLRSWQERYPHLLAGSEATAEYHRALAQVAVQSGIPFRLLNPILTKQFTRATIRKKKTDHTDAGIIAKLLARGEGTPVSEAMLSPLKSLHRSANKINQLKKTLSAIMQHLTAVGAGAYIDLDALASKVDGLEQTVATVRKCAQQHVDPVLKTLLASIPGIGATIATTLILEIGDIARFPSAKSLIAYAGLDPKVKQSGRSLHHNTRITKRGSPALRQSAYIAAYIAARHDPELKAYFEKKINEGKRYKEAVVAGARKILTRVYAVWKRGTPYERALECSRHLTPGSSHEASDDPGAFCEVVLKDNGRKSSVEYGREEIAERSRADNPLITPQPLCA